VTQLHSSAAIRLLDRDLPEGYLDEKTALVSAQPQVVEGDERSVVVFRLGSEWMSLSTAIFQEVAERSLVHRLPHQRNGAVAGLVNIRGELLLCVGLDVLLGLGKLPPANDSNEHASKQRLLVCNRGGDRLAFLVDEVSGVHRFHPRDLREVPATVAKSSATYTLGLLQWMDKTIGCLDDELLFYAFNKEFA
jgi:chemotaxis-related protein WspD